MTTKTIEAYDENHAIEIMSHYWRSYDLLALQALNSHDRLLWSTLYSKRDAAYREYCGLTGLRGTEGVMSIMQPSGMI